MTQNKDQLVEEVKRLFLSKYSEIHLAKSEYIMLTVSSVSDDFAGKKVKQVPYSRSENYLVANLLEGIGFKNPRDYRIDELRKILQTKDRIVFTASECVCECAVHGCLPCDIVYVYALIMVHVCCVYVCVCASLCVCARVVCAPHDCILCVYSLVVAKQRKFLYWCVGDGHHRVGQ